MIKPIPGYPYTMNMLTMEVLSIKGQAPTRKESGALRMWRNKTGKVFTLEAIRTAVETGKEPVSRPHGGLTKHDENATEYRDRVKKALRIPTPHLDMMFADMARDARMVPCL